jgi:hypothetical protein
MLHIGNIGIGRFEPMAGSFGNHLNHWQSFFSWVWLDFPSHHQVIKTPSHPRGAHEQPKLIPSPAEVLANPLGLTTK